MAQHSEKSRVTLVVFLFLVLGCQGITCTGLHGKVSDPHVTTILQDNTFSIPIMDHYLPKENNLRIKKLFRILGNMFDPEWMSVEQPEASNDLPDTSSLADVHSSNTVIESHRLNELIKATTGTNLLNNHTILSIKSFMLQLSSCKTKYVWEDQGVLFWPRYVRTGTCVYGGSCSWPRGMTCVPDESKTLQILRWRCKRFRGGKRKKANDCDKESRKGRKRSIRCKWKKIKYRVTDKCICSCQ